MRTQILIVCAIACTMPPAAEAASFEYYPSERCSVVQMQLGDDYVDTAHMRCVGPHSDTRTFKLDKKILLAWPKRERDALWPMTGYHCLTKRYVTSVRLNYFFVWDIAFDVCVKIPPAPRARPKR